jgi:predicted MFS family arabinose efflux permease
VIPVPIRLAVVAIGIAIFLGSWLIGNTVDSAQPPEGAEGAAMLQKDALTFFMRIIGAALVTGGLLLWVVAALATHAPPAQAAKSAVAVPAGPRAPGQGAIAPASPLLSP